jgi:multisubunit Na+/H+ antiporter MnhE subunit
MHKDSINTNSTDELSLVYFFKKNSICSIICSLDFIRASICSLILYSIIGYFSIHLAHVDRFFLNTSDVIFSNSITIDSSLLGLIIAAIAIFASFSRPEILAQLYIHKKDEANLHQYVLVLFFPAIPAILGLFFSFIGNVLLTAKSEYTIYIAFLVTFFTFYCIFGVWESILQIAKSIITQAKMYKEQK